MEIEQTSVMTEAPETPIEDTGAVGLSDTNVNDSPGVASSVDALAQDDDAHDDGHDTTPNQSESSARENERRRREKPADPEQKQEAIITVIKAAAIQRAQLASENPHNTINNQAEASMTVLGHILQGRLPKGQTELLFTGGDAAVFGPAEPLPRVLVENGKVPRLTYDKRASDDSEDATTIGQGVFELHAFLGKTPEGTYRFRAKDSTGNTQNVIALPESNVVQLFVLTQYRPMSEGLAGIGGLTAGTATKDTYVHRIMQQYVDNCGRLIGTMNVAKPYGEDNFDVTQGIGDEDIESALERTSVSAKSVRTFAENMQKYIETDAWKNRDDRARYTEEIKQIIDVLDQGLQPTASQLQRLMVIGATPRLDTQEVELRQKIDVTTKSGKDTKELEDALTSLRDFRAGGTDSIYRQYLEAIVQGEVDPKDAEWLNEQLKEAQDPWAILKSHDIHDDKCLAGKAFKHLKAGLDEEQTKKVEAWLSKFFKEHGSDIAMMGIFALFQMMTQMIGDAAKNA